MQRISTSTKAVDLFGAGKHGFKDGNLASGILPTDLEAAWFNSLQEEVLNVVEGAGLAADGESLTQVKDAIAIMVRKQSAAIASATGGADALIGEFTPEVPALANGLTVYLRAASANTTFSPTFTPAVGVIAEKVIVKGSNMALVAGDIAGAGHWLALKYDLTLDKWALLNPALGVGILPLLAGPLGSSKMGYGKITVAGALTLSDERTHVLIPKTGSLYAFGDSQTWGTNLGTGLDYTDGSRLLAPYRWIDQLATRHDRSLTINNFGIPGSRLSWVLGVEYLSHFNRLGRLPFDWTGVCVMMAGWNSIQPSNDGSAEFYKVFRRASETLIARSLLTDWFGITHYGWTRALGSGGSTYQWDTNTTEADLGPGIPGEGYGNDRNPFYYGDLAGERYSIALTPGKYIQFGAADSRACGLFFDTTPSATACTFSVTVNGVVIGTFDSSYLAPAPLAADSFPYSVFLDDMPADSTVRVECIAGEVRWLAGGTVPRDPVASPNRAVLYGTPTGNTANGRPASHIHQCAKQVEAAVAAFSDRHPVYLVNNITNWDDATDQEASDISHLTDIGNEKVHQNFTRAAKPAGGDSPNVISIREFMSGFSSAKYSSVRLWGFGPVAADGYLEETIGIPGVTPDCLVIAAPVGAFLEPGVFLTATCTAAGVARVRFNNSTGAIVYPAPVNIRVTAWLD